MCGNLMDYITYTFPYKNIGRANAPLKLLASDRNNLIRWPDRVSNPGTLTYESGAIPTALRGPATL